VRRLSSLLLVVLLVGAATAACSKSAETGDKGYVDGTGIITRLDTADRKKPREVSGETLEGKPVSLAQYAGKVVVLNVWGSWCSPCRKESGALTGAARELDKEPGVVFLGINTRDASRDPALAFQRRFDVPYPSIFDPSGRTLLAFYGTLNPSAIPSTVVLDSDGRVAASIIGEVPSKQTLVDLVEDVQKQGAS
jgi:thiol-disulfide isomerase/thioredoxin